MENNLPQKYNDGIIFKLRNLIYRVFNKSINKTKDVCKSDVILEFQDNNFKVDTTKEQSKELLINIENNPDLINDWSIERLKNIEEIYDQKIKELESKITKLKSTIV